MNLLHRRLRETEKAMELLLEIMPVETTMRLAEMQAWVNALDAVDVSALFRCEPFT